MKAIFYFTPMGLPGVTNASSLQLANNLLYQDDFGKYLQEKKNRPLIISLDEVANYPEKERMYAYYHGPLLDCAVQGYAAAGWEGVDKVVADYKLLAEVGKDYIKNPEGEYEPYLLPKSGMTKDRFHKYLHDCILFLETELHQKAPDSEAYKMKEQTGYWFKSVKYDKEQ